MIDWPIIQIFRENYSEVVADLEDSNAARIEVQFSKLAQSNQPTALLIKALYDIGTYLSKHAHKNNINISSTCLPCLAHYPSLTLACGHRFCQDCVRSFGHHIGGAEFRLTHCMLCGIPNNAPIYIKPVAAGLRILKLSGGIRCAANLALALKQLEQALESPLYLHFDLVIGVGIGRILARTMFCEDGRIKDFLLQFSNRKKFSQGGWQPSRDPHLKTGSGNTPVAELPNHRLTILADWYVLSSYLSTFLNAPEAVLIKSTQFAVCGQSFMAGIENRCESAIQRC